MKKFLIANKDHPKNKDKLEWIIISKIFQILNEIRLKKSKF